MFRIKKHIEQFYDYTADNHSELERVSNKYMDQVVNFKKNKNDIKIRYDKMLSDINMKKSNELSKSIQNSRKTRQRVKMICKTNVIQKVKKESIIQKIKIINSMQDKTIKKLLQQLIK